VIKPTRKQWLTFFSLVVSAGLFVPLWNQAIKVWPEAELLQTMNELLGMADEPEVTNAPPTDQRPESPHKPMHHAGDEQFFRELKWLRTDTWGPNARVTKRMDLVSISRNGMRYKADDLSDWKAAELVGVMCIAVNRGGRWEGGKFDHVRADTRDRDFKNVCGYINVCPKSGEVVRFWLISYDGKQASNYVEARWP
jgi:hypothetical protein